MNSKKEFNEIIDGIKITYKFKAKKYDTKHLIFIFSGFSGGGIKGNTYDFENALDYCPANIIWIKDAFPNLPIYYLCKDMDFSYEESISKFIELKIIELELSRNDCTIAGFSKGGTAALYFGIKHNIKNIVSTVPQFNIGSYIKDNWKRTAIKMMGENITQEKINILNQILPKMIDSDKSLEKNIYLFSSRKDIQYSKEIQPNLYRFNKYSNFNLFMSNSLLVNEHKQVTQYHVPLLLGIFYSLSQGAIPQYGLTELYGEQKRVDMDVNPKAIAKLYKYEFKGNLFFPEGLAYIETVPCEHYRDIKTVLNFRSDRSNISLPLAKDHKPNLSRDLYKNGYVNYDKAWFCTLKYAGLDLSSLLSQKGNTYKLSISIKTEYHNIEQTLTTKSPIVDQIIIENEKFKLFTNKQREVLLYIKQ